MTWEVARVLDIEAARLVVLEKGNLPFTEEHDMNTDRLTTLFGVLSGLAGGMAVMFPGTAVVTGPLFAILQTLKGYYTNK